MLLLMTDKKKSLKKYINLKMKKNLAGRFVDARTMTSVTTSTSTSTSTLTSLADDVRRNATRCPRPVVDADADSDANFEFVTEGVLILVVGVVGLLGNLTSIYTFSRQKVHRIFHNLLLFLAIFDVVSTWNPNSLNTLRLLF